MINHNAYFKHLCFLYIVFFWAILCTSQNQPYFKNFTAIDGLTSNEVYGITQDTEGYLWFATDRGLTRYDGTTFKRFTISDGLPDNVVYNFFEMEDGTIWCSTSNNTIFYFKNASEGFHLYPYNHIIKNAWPKNIDINNIALTENNELLISFIGIDGYLKIDKSGAIRYKLKESTHKEFHLLNTLKDAPDFLYIGDYQDSINTKSTEFQLTYSLTNNSASGFSRVVNFPNQAIKICFFSTRAFIIHTNTGKTKKVRIKKTDNIPIIAGKYDENHFWVGYQYGGVRIFDLQGTQKNFLFKDKSVTKMYTDHEGGLWVSTLNAGVFYSKQPYINHYAFDSYPIELTKNSKNQLYASFHNGEIFKKEDDSFYLNHSSKVKFPNRIQYDKKNDTLLTNSYYSTIGLSKNKTNYIKGISDDEKFTFPFHKNSFFIKRDSTFDKINVPYRIFDISKMDSTVFIGTDTGLFKHANDTDTILPVNHKHSQYQYRISDIDSKYQNLYVSTMGAGISIQKKDTLFSITKKNGLLSNICTELYVEDKYTVWVGTNLGLQRVTLFGNNTYNIETLSIPQGLICSEITDIEIIKDTIWVASKEGLFSVPKKIVNQLNTKFEKWFHIDKIFVNEKPISFEDKLILPHTTHTLKIGFKSISFKEGKETLYRYKIRDSDTEWNYTKNNTIEILNATPGNYDIAIQIKAEDSTWGNSMHKNIIIKPPFWKSTWFLFSVFTIISILIYLAFIYRVLVFNTTYLKKIAIALIQRIKRNTDTTLYVIIKYDGKTIKIPSTEIGYFKSSRNYVEIYTSSKKYLVRKKIDDFYNDLPDSFEYIKIHRSYYVRINKVTQKNNHKEVIVFDTPIPVSKTYAENLQLLKF